MLHTHPKPLLTLALSVFGTLASAASAAEPPNIVLLLVEDLSPRIGAFGDPVANTPNLDELAAEGLRLTNVFTAAPVCAPSRAALFTGLYPQTFGAQHMRARQSAVPPAGVIPFPEILREHGYYTIMQGKNDFQFDAPSTMWDVNSPDASLKNLPADQPFFAVFQNGATHESGLWRDWGVQLKRFAKTATNCVSCALAMLKPARWNDAEVPPYLPDTPKVRAEMNRLYANVHVMDAWVGQQMAQLDRAGLLDDTVVIWTTDHGDGLPRAKRSLYDSGIKVPMIIRYPDGSREGQIDKRLVSFVDLPAMILTLAGIDPPAYLTHVPRTSDGLPERETIFAVSDRMDNARDRGRAVRDTQYKYIRNYEPDAPLLAEIPYRERLDSMSEMRRLQSEGTLSPTLEAYLAPERAPEELYDIQADPHEMINLAADPTQADILQARRDTLDAWLAETGDLSDIPEDEMSAVLWEGEAQPRTAPPRFAAIETDAGPALAITSDSEGASIEFRQADDPDARWRLYTGPLALPVAGPLEARASRYGFKPSDHATSTPEDLQVR